MQTTMCNNIIHLRKNFRKVLDEHVPLKIRIIREKQAELKANEPRKGIVDQSTLKNRYLN